MSSFFKVFISFAIVVTVHASEDETSSEYDFGKFDGLVRLYHVFAPAFVKSGRSEDYAIDGSTIGGHLRYHTPKYSGFGATTAVYYSTGSGFNNKHDLNTIIAAGRFFTPDYESRAVLGELNVHYKDENHYAIAGHFKLDTPLTNAITTYMPNMYEAVLYKNSSLASTSITLAQIDKMAYGTRAPVEFGLIGETTRTGGTTQNGINTRGDFKDIEEQTLADENAKTDGITVLGLENTSLPKTTIRAWNFYAHDIINMFYLDATYKEKETSMPYTLSAQYLRIDSVGKDLASKWLDSDSAYLFGVKATLKYKKSLFYLAYNHSGSSKILNPWSGDPAYTSSFFSKNAYRANVDAYKIGFNYDILKNLKLITSHADYGKSTTPGTFAPSKPVEAASMPKGYAFESVLLLSYKPVKELTVLGGFIYKTSEYHYAGEQVKLLDADLVITYKF